MISLNLNNFNKNKIINTFLIFLTVIASVQATANNDKKFYIDGELGYSSLASGYVYPYQLKDKQRFGYRLSMGYLFPLNEMLRIGPEMGYAFYGKLSYLNSTGLVANYSLTGWHVMCNFKYKPISLINLYLKTGVTQLSQHLVIVGPNVTPGGFYQQALKPMILLGTSYNLSPRTELLLTYTHIFGDKAPLTSNQQFTFKNVNQIPSVDAALIGFIYYF